jgi:hypothetical protein
LCAGCGEEEDLAQRLPEPQRPVADREHRGAHAAQGAVTQQVRPRLARLPVAGIQCYQLFAPVGAHPKQDQHARLGLIQANLQVHSISPHVHVIAPGQVAARQVPRDVLITAWPGAPWLLERLLGGPAQATG